MKILRLFTNPLSRLREKLKSGRDKLTGGASEAAHDVRNTITGRNPFVWLRSKLSGAFSRLSGRVELGVKLALGFTAGVLILRARIVTQGLEGLTGKRNPAAAGFFTRLLLEDAGFIAGVLNAGTIAGILTMTGYGFLVLGVLMTRRRS